MDATQRLLARDRAKARHAHDRARAAYAAAERRYLEADQRAAIHAARVADLGDGEPPWNRRVEGDYDLLAEADEARETARHVLEAAEREVERLASGVIPAAPPDGQCERGRPHQWQSSQDGSFYCLECGTRHV